MKATSKTLLYKILDLLHEKGGMTLSEISEETGYPLPSIRRTMGELNSLKKILKTKRKVIYRLK